MSLLYVHFTISLIYQKTELCADSSGIWRNGPATYSYSIFRKKLTILHKTTPPQQQQVLILVNDYIKSALHKRKALLAKKPTERRIFISAWLSMTMNL